MVVISRVTFVTELVERAPLVLDVAHPAALPPVLYIANAVPSACLTKLHPAGSVGLAVATTTTTNTDAEEGEEVV